MTTFGVIPRKPRSGGSTPTPKANQEAPVWEARPEAGTGILSLLYASSELGDGTPGTEAQAESTGCEVAGSASCKRPSPVEFHASPPESPSVVLVNPSEMHAAPQAAAKVAAAECKTWMSGEPGTSATPTPSSSTPSETSAQRDVSARDDQVDSNVTGTASKADKVRRQGGTKSHYHHRRDASSSDTTSPPFDMEEAYKQGLKKIVERYNWNHPEVGKSHLQMAKFYVGRNQRGKCEECLLLAWGVFKHYVDKSSNIDEVFSSFMSLFEEFQVTTKELGTLKREMELLSPRGQKRPRSLELDLTSPRGPFDQTQTPK